jgi:hypothetical protein
MAVEPKFARALVDRVSNYRKTAPVFQLVERPIEMLEREAFEFGRRFDAAPDAADARADLQRDKQSTTVQFPGGTTVKLFHASGAMIARRSLPPAAHLFEQAPPKDTLVSRAHDAVRRLGLGQSPNSIERLEFERLWQIKAAGRQPNGAGGYETLCRAVGAFRRFIHELPVLGRASVFVKLAADEVIEAAGSDWRPCEERAFDEATIIDPSEAALRIASELSVAAGSPNLSNYEVDFFGLGYVSFPKRRVQSVLQPVYVALVHTRGWTTLGRIVVVSATERAYEPIGRVLAAPPRPLTAKPTRR